MKAVAGKALIKIKNRLEKKEQAPKRPLPTHYLSTASLPCAALSHTPILTGTAGHFIHIIRNALQLPVAGLRNLVVCELAQPRITDIAHLSDFRP